VRAVGSAHSSLVRQQGAKVSACAPTAPLLGSLSRRGAGLVSSGGAGRRASRSQASLRTAAMHFRTGTPLPPLVLPPSRSPHRRLRESALRAGASRRLVLGRAGLCCVLALAGACAALGAELEADGDRTPVALDPQEKLARGLSHAQEPLSLADARARLAAEGRFRPFENIGGGAGDGAGGDGDGALPPVEEDSDAGARVLIRELGPHEQVPPRPAPRAPRPAPARPLACPRALTLRRGARGTRRSTRTCRA